MRISEFAIGLEFTLDDALWRVTDVGSRTVVAIRIDRTTTVRSRLVDGVVVRVGEIELTGAEAVARGDFRGPPYGVAEHVIDEHDLPRCRPAKSGCGYPVLG